MAKKPKKTALKVNIPLGTAGYLNLTRPDTKYHEHGVYKASVRIPVEEAKPLMKQLQEVAKAHTGKPMKAKDNACWKFETDDEGEETGIVVFSAKVKNIITKKGELWDRKPVLFDAGGRPITSKNINPSAGSKIIVSCEVYEWSNDDDAGINLQPLAVQIVDLVNYEGGRKQDAGDFGFGSVAGGFSVDADTDEDEDEDVTDASTSDEEEEDDNPLPKKAAKKKSAGDVGYTDF